jgi:hypothetical protein
VEGIRDVEISIDAGEFFPGINKGNNVWLLPATVNINPGTVTRFVNDNDPNDRGGDTALLQQVGDSIQLTFQSDAFDPPDAANIESYSATNRIGGEPFVTLIQVKSPKESIPESSGIGLLGFAFPVLYVAKRRRWTLSFGQE